MKDHANTIIAKTLEAVNPYNATVAALQQIQLGNSIYLVAIGKAAFTMAKAAKAVFDDRIKKGVAVTKYGHAKGIIDGITIIEAGHPLPDAQSLLGGQAVLDMTAGLTAADEILLLLSGGGSALFEVLEDGITLADAEGITQQLLSCGADIVEINTIRKRLSKVKGGKFAAHCAPAFIHSFVLSDVLGDRLDTVASGPAYPDNTTAKDAFDIVKKYNLSISLHVAEALSKETQKSLNNVDTCIVGNVSQLCDEAAKAAYELGYEPTILTRSLNCEAKEAGRFLAAIAREIAQTSKTSCAIIVGGETVVTLQGKGKGGRNQELALAAAEGIGGLSNTLIFALGSDGTDGPTDAAGGIVDGESKKLLDAKGKKITEILADNDSYHGLALTGGLIVTGPTGGNVNDIAVILCRV